jgi:putative transcriptional regulator
MKSRKPRKPLFERLKTGLEEAILHARGEIVLKTTVVRLPDPPPEIGPEELARMRVDSQMSLAMFARLLNVSIGAVRSWEIGTRKPSRAALRLIQVFRENPSSVLEAAGIAQSAGNVAQKNEPTKVSRNGRRPPKTPRSHQRPPRPGG